MPKRLVDRLVVLLRRPLVKTLSLVLMVLLGLAFDAAMAGVLLLFLVPAAAWLVP